MVRLFKGLAFTLSAALIFAAGTASAQFYKGKTLNVIINYGEDIWLMVAATSWTGLVIITILHIGVQEWMIQALLKLKRSDGPNPVLRPMTHLWNSRYNAFTQAR